jgi:hypothetical protein
MAINYHRETGIPAVLFCDRGLFDGKAYNKKDHWKEILKR